MSENVLKQVVWFLKAKNLIKFTDSEATYKLSDPLLKEVISILKGDKVEVGIKDGIILYLKKSEEAPKAEPVKVVEPPKEPKPEVKEPTQAGETQELTVHGVAANKKVVKFAELKDAGWFQIAEELQSLDYSTIGLVAKNRVKVQIVEKTIISVAKVAVEATEQSKTEVSSPEKAKTEEQQAEPLKPALKKEWKPASSYDTAEKQTSIEAQAAVNSACEVAAKVAAAITTASQKADGSTNAPTANVINNIIRAIAESNFSLIQELKKK